MNEVDTLMLIIGLLSGLGFAVCVALSLPEWPKLPRPTIKWLAEHMSSFNSSEKPRIRPVFQ